MVAVKLQDVTKSFGGVVAVNTVSLEIAEGELFFILGPSGCGKTTILRTIAGFEIPDSGRVYFDGSDMSRMPPERRNSGMVFQNYALWPHMTVFDNVAYGLRVRGIDRSAIASRVREALEMVRMSAESRRSPNQLSGGQQQRVALARALVIKPSCLLLDEPLSNLDAKLRLEMRSEIRRIHSESRITTIYVTHDQKEALSMAERLAVVSQGRVIQIGSPDSVYRRPADSFVAAFIGETNVVLGTIRAVEGGRAVAETDVGAVAGIIEGLPGLGPGQPCTISIRPEEIEISDAPLSSNCVKTQIAQYTFLGETGQYVCTVAGVAIKVLVMAPGARRPDGSSAYLVFPADKVRILPRSTRFPGED